MKIVAKISLIVLSLFSVLPLHAEVPLSRLDWLTKGIGISHWYWMRQGTLIDHYIIPADIQALKVMGVKHVRISFEMADLDKPEIVKQLKRDIQAFVDQKIGVMVSAFGDMYNRDVIATSKANALLEKLCQEVIHSFSPDFVVVQIANEPWVEEPEHWSKIQNGLIQTARKILPEHTLITSIPLKYGKGNGEWSMFQAFARMTPSDDSNVVYAFHFYEPFLFTHQGADWDPNAIFVKKWAYPTNPENSEQVIKTLDPKAPSWISGVLQQTWGKEQLQKSLVPILEWREKYKRPVIVTEFGVYKPHVDFKSRLKWFADAVSVLNESKLGWTYWDYGGGFGLFYDKDGFRILDPEGADALGFAISKHL